MPVASLPTDSSTQCRVCRQKQDMELPCGPTPGARGDPWPPSLPFYMSPPGWLLCLVGVGASAGLKLEGRGDLPLFFFSPLFILKSHSFLHPFIHSFSDTVHRPCASPIRSVKVVILVSAQRPRGISWEGCLAPPPPAPLSSFLLLW